MNSLNYLNFNKGLIKVYTMRDIRENNNILLGIEKSKYFKIILLSSFSKFVQLDIDEILS